MKSSTKTEYIGCTIEQIKWGGNDDPRDVLTLGSIYTVKNIVRKNWHSKLELEEFPGKLFNSICFETLKTCSGCSKTTPNRAWCKECKCCVFCCKAGDTIPTHVTVIL